MMKMSRRKLEKLQVIISTYNRLGLLKQTIESLRKNSDNPLEIIVVCDNLDSVSPDLAIKRKEYLDSQADIIKYYFDEKQTIAGIKRKGYGMRTSDEPYVYFSDDDVYFEPHWDSALIRILEALPDVGVVGGRHHPHHKIFSTRVSNNGVVLICEQQAGYSL